MFCFPAVMMWFPCVPSGYQYLRKDAPGAFTTDSMKEPYNWGSATEALHTTEHWYDSRLALQLFWVTFIA